MTDNSFISRNKGPRENEVKQMLKKMGLSSLDALIEETIPSSIRLDKPLDLPEGISEYEFSKKIKTIASKNKVYKSYIGMGYYDTITPAVVIRNILENPTWYTSYTPYQSEISQGRLEALLDFQTAVTDLTGMEIATNSLLDEATAAAESMIMMHNLRSRKDVQAGKNILFVDENIFPQTIDVIKTRSNPLGIKLVTGKFNEFEFNEKIFGAIVQYPAANGEIKDYSEFVNKAHNNNSLVTVVADILSLAVLTPPGEWGADIVTGNTQRFGVPMFYGGPHSAYIATYEKYKRYIPGRIVGISIDQQGNKALRMALQSREQHIKRERATSNICTAQALSSIMAAMYAVYHGYEGIKNIAYNIHYTTGILSEELIKLGYSQNIKNFFDTLEISLPDNIISKDIQNPALEQKMNFRYVNDKTIGISVDETTLIKDINLILEVFAIANNKQIPKINTVPEKIYFDNKFKRTSDFMTESIFDKYHSETEMMRYIKRLERKDFALNYCMTPLGSCTMKLNPANSLLPISWIELNGLHPFCPKEQAQGYAEIIKELEHDLSVITGFKNTSLQPNSGAAGEYAGLMVIRQYHISRGDTKRNVVLIPASAHGTNPASSAMAGNKVIVVNCDEKGNVDIDDLRKKIEENKEYLNAFMVTYPSTHGVFEEKIKEMIDITHTNGGLVYMDGANMNGQIGITNPGVIGADVCHLNLHKTFSSPHGGGGPGVGPICANEQVSKFLPGHSVVKGVGGEQAITAVSSAPYGSAGLLPITYAYIKMLGCAGLKESTEIAILNANYLVNQLKSDYKILYLNDNGRCGHEMILDCREFKNKYDVTTEEISKRLMDYGFHAPTLSFPVHETLMIEPTESESLSELDRFVDAMLSVKKELDEIAEGKADKQDNVFHNAPHTAEVVTADEWNHKYSREKAAYANQWLKNDYNKFWPAVGKVDNGYGDRHLVCSWKGLKESL
jgi:glycine dehydrogenase